MNDIYYFWFQKLLERFLLTFRTLHSLWGYLKERDVDVEKIKRDLHDIVVKTLLSVESQLFDMSRANLSSRYACYELFGFDVLLDGNFKPWLLEVNISPSLHSTSSLDLSVKVVIDF